MNDNEYIEKKILAAIDRTGFNLEYEIQQVLRLHGWHVINNRYYIDDARDVEREIDIIAYKGAVKGVLTCYTYLVISCKKTMESSWVFLTSEKDETDQNFDYYPLEYISGDEDVMYLFQKEKVLVINELRKMCNVYELVNAHDKVFAFR